MLEHKFKIKEDELKIKELKNNYEPHLGEIYLLKIKIQT
jgi:hypothetical protein